jgi:uncharacterized protein YlxP (DUF503 family)
VAVGTVELHLPDVESLKGKRHALKGLKDTLRRFFEDALDIGCGGKATTAEPFL